ncbi:carboxylesterase/lipase family protein [Gordonia desulfuricans]|uniref:carboxylesterase/lipase family protein n=1 Tax=Gordonia desulfuricans TaxID=89051 RepID=UPI00073F9010|nr:carboxylesterase/lipase family protein [Gordonia desulfuricans]
MNSRSAVVETTSGPYRGVVEGPVTVWRGMRFAAPPIGENRWRRAQPAPVHTEIVEADRPGSVCPQQVIPVVGLGPDAVMDEDCLFLNVWSPSGSDGPALPVMVWLHGGAYVYGSGSQPLYDGTVLARTAGIVVVTVNYRIGAFGFADMRTVVDDAESNPALSDVLAALRWVQDNIAGFGGDPAQVTVAGESAGGGMVTTLLAMPAATGLFARAISQSSPASTIFTAERMAVVADLLHRGIPAGLRDASAEHLVEAGMSAFADVPQASPGILAYTPTVDGDLLPRHPMDVFAAGESLPVPLLIGSNRDEATVFKYMKSPLMPIDLDVLRRMFLRLADERPDLPIPDEHVIESLYPRRKSAAGVGMARDLAFRMPALWVAEPHSRIAPVYLYRFDWAPPMFRVMRLGATHAAELGLTWGNISIGKRDITYRLGGRGTAETLSARMVARWGAFVRGAAPDHVTGTTLNGATLNGATLNGSGMNGTTLNGSGANGSGPNSTGPNSAGVSWPAYTPERRATMVIGAADRVVDDLDGALRQTWGEVALGFR